jgi:hypothetical protein
MEEPTDVVTGARPSARATIFVRIAFAVAVGYLVLTALTGRIEDLFVPSIWLAAGLVRWLRTPTVVTAAGVEVPHFRFKPVERLAWDDVSAVAAPNSWDTHVILLRSAKPPVNLIDVKKVYAADVARIGGKDMRRAPKVPVTASPSQPAIPRRPTDAQVEKDLRLRAERLAAEARRLQASLDAKGRA